MQKLKRFAEFDRSMRVSLRAIGLRAKACALRDVREKSLNYDNGADIMRSNEAIKGWRQGSGGGSGGGGVG